jgi:VIT1/CCC1 family predicted Fe2+/Mn2+ transporter
MSQIPDTHLNTITPKRRWSPRGIAENTATILIALGVIMLMQPFFLVLYTYSFIVTLIGTLLFIVGSKFPE